MNTDISNWENIRVVAFDFFDTLVHRNCHPEIVLYNWAKKLSVFIDYSVEPSVLYSLRKQQEGVNRKKINCEETSYEVLIQSIYDNISSLVKPNITFEQFYAKSFEIECLLEHEATYVNKDILPLIHKAINDKKRIIVISDFYCGQMLIESILLETELSCIFDKIFVSSDCGVRKSTGKLYKYVLDQLNITSKELLMIGDNKHSDVQVPKQLGISTLYVPYSNKNKIYDKVSLKKQLKKIMFSNLKESPFNGYLSTILYFISSLYEELVKKHVKNVLFCSREGQLMKELFDIYQNSTCVGIKINTHYFYVSRRSTLMPSLDKLENEKFIRIFRQFKQLNLKDFLYTIGFDHDGCDMVIQETGCSGTDIVKDLSEHSVLQTIIKNQKFGELYERIRLEQKRNFKEYIKSIDANLFEEGLVMVDVGWKGTIQDNIQAALDYSIPVYGYYLGLKIDDQINCITENKKGLLFSNVPCEVKNYRILTKDYMLYERIFVANHGPVLGYEKHIDNRITPIISDENSELELYEFIKEFQRNFVSGFQEAIQIFEKSKWNANELYHQMITLILWQDCVIFPKLWSYEKNVRAKSRENFGDISKNKIKSKNKLSSEHLKKIKFLFVDYSYRIPQKMHMKFLFPLSKVYCILVYIINYILIKQ
ncbi:HAD-IA family hydrolase [Clostridium lundense]|uniref:HAD-IA family hydrolase n=1 Tax=Clostridium lundense TaxID=319475 RepID=UPI00048900DC|nr:HAD-IA family hydrolase [Clostridium lundense]